MGELGRGQHAVEVRKAEAVNVAERLDRHVVQLGQLPPGIDHHCAGRGQAGHGDGGHGPVLGDLVGELGYVDDRYSQGVTEINLHVGAEPFPEQHHRAVRDGPELTVHNGFDLVDLDAFDAAAKLEIDVFGG